MNETQRVFIVDGIRTPILKSKNRPGPFTAADLAVHAGRVLLLRYPEIAATINEVILGCVMPGADEANIARIAALRLGLDKSIPAWTVQRNCASGLQALDTAVDRIASGRSDIVLAGGVEAMSYAPLLFSPQMASWLGSWLTAKQLDKKLAALRHLRPVYFKPIIGLLRGLTDPVVNLSMGQTAENVAYRFGIERQAMDEFAFESHYRLARAQDDGTFDHEITPLYDTRGECYQYDNGLRRDTVVSDLGKLKPVFDRRFGKITAGNSAQISDGAAWLLVASQSAVDQYQLPVLGSMTATQWAGVDPAEMGLGPVYAANALLKAHGLRSSDIDYWELNEAFAGQVLACLAAWEDENYCRRELGLDTAFGSIDRERLNVDGGAIACGHPVGMSGARLVLHLLNVLRKYNAQRGVATLCIGGGMGGAVLLERSGS